MSNQRPTNEDIHDYLLKVSRKHHKPIHRTVKKNGVTSLSRTKHPVFFDFLARTVIGQQLAGKSARAIWGRVESLASEKSCLIIELFKDENYEIIRQCGLSNVKVKTLILLRSKFKSREISEKEIKNGDYSYVTEKILSLWGFGPWSADMVALSYLSLPDVWPSADGSLNRAINLLLPDYDPSEVASKYSPYRSYLARHIWKGLDTGFISNLK